MTPSVSVVVPVLDGEAYLADLFDGLLSQGEELEVLVIDSGSRDRSREVARTAGATVLEIPPGRFGHGRTRNLGVERTRGDLICFLTQDATPLPGWLDAYLEAFELDERVGAAYGPHLPRPNASPMIARELTEFFASFAPDGRPVVQRRGDVTFLSNVNACYARECLAEIGFRDVRYSEDQAFGADMLERGWVKVFHPGAAVLHSHDYPIPEFLRRYFDEYRGLRESIGHVEDIAPGAAMRDIAGLVRADLRWMREHDYPVGERLRWTARAGVHHGGRRLFSVLGSRAQSLPAGVQRRLSLEGTVAGRDLLEVAGDDPMKVASSSTNGAAAAASPDSAPQLPELQRIDWVRPRDDYWAIARFLAEGPAPLLPAVRGMAEKRQLHLAFVVPPFGIGSGGHGTIFKLLHLLEQRGHTCSIWVHDPFGERQSEWPAVMRRVVVEHFSPVAAPLHKEFDEWRGADVVIATGWQTVYPTMLLPNVRARAYMINDHEPTFYSTSVESFWAEQTYRLGLYGICASPWLRDLYVEHYGGAAGYFELGVDLDVYQPRPIERERETVVFYCRPPTGRRAFALGRMALQELHARRPALRVVTFGARDPVRMAFQYEHAGVTSPTALSWLYSQATVGLCMSMTNYSLIPQEMLACGLPCVELLHPSAEGVFGLDGPVSLAPFRPDAIAASIDRLMSDEALWQRRSQAGLDFVGGRSWEGVADVVERELREALRLREQGRDVIPTPQLDLVPIPDLPEVQKAVHWGHDRSAEEVQTHLVTDTLFERLTEDDIEGVQAALDVQQRQAIAAADPAHTRTLTLAFGVHHGLKGVIARTGLSPATPPEDIHAMQRGADSAGGGYWYADLVAEEVVLAGIDPSTLRSALDFGCSSGRVVRVLAAAFGQTCWLGCDPNAEAIEWATAHLPGVDWFASPQEPPLPLADGELDFAFAISIWSHYGPEAAVAWLKEMERVIAPGGHLLLTTHGPISLDYYLANGRRAPEQIDEIARALSLRGYWFADEFGPEGDWGVRHSEWGTAFVSPQWLLARLGHDWELVHFGPGKVEFNQDVYMLKRS